MDGIPKHWLIGRSIQGATGALETTQPELAERMKSTPRPQVDARALASSISATRTRTLPEMLSADRARVLDVLAVTGMTIDPLVTQAIAAGWTVGHFVAARNSEALEALKKAAKRTGLLRPATVPPRSN